MELKFRERWLLFSNDTIIVVFLFQEGTVAEADKNLRSKIVRNLIKNLCRKPMELSDEIRSP